MKNLVGVVSATAAISAVAGSAFGQFTYNGAAPADSNWSTGANWVGGAAPAAGGGAGIDLTFGPAPNAARRNTVQNHGNPFNLRALTFAANAGGAYDITSNPVAAPLRFNGNALIINNTNDVSHTINSPIVLNANLGIGGTANTVNDRSQLDLIGRITEAAAGLSINIRMEANTDVIFSGNNGGAGGFSGGVAMAGGVLVLDNNNGLGRGTLTIQRYQPPPGGQGVLTLAMRASDGNTITYPNNTRVLTNAAWGTNDVTQPTTLRTTGTTTFNNNLTMSLVGGRNHTTALGGDIVVAANTTLTVNGDTAPTLEKGAIRNRNQAGDRRNDNLGSVLRWDAAGGIAGLAGNVTITSATLEVNCNVGTPNARTGAVITAGDGTTAAAVTGSSTVAGPRQGIAANTPRYFFNNTGGITAKKNAAFTPGRSPGIVAVNGGFVDMEPGSNFAITLNGAEPGSGEGFYGQLLLEEGARMSLLTSPAGERPVLGIDLQTWSEAGSPGFFLPLAGMQFTVIDQDSAVAPSLYTAADPFGYGGNMFADFNGAALTEGATFSNDNLPGGLMFQISYFGGDTGNDVVLTIVPTPGVASVLALGGLAALRRRRC